MRVRNTPPVVVISAALLLGLGACRAMRTFPSLGTFVEGTPLEVTSYDALWERATTTLQSEGYPVDADGTTRSAGEIASGWSARFSDVRRRAFVLMDEGPVGQWVVRVAVERERRDGRAGPFGPHQVEWQEDGADPETARFLLFKIEMAFSKARDRSDER